MKLSNMALCSGGGIMYVHMINNIHCFARIVIRWYCLNWFLGVC